MRLFSKYLFLKNTSDDCFCLWSIARRCSQKSLRLERSLKIATKSSIWWFSWAQLFFICVVQEAANRGVSIKSYILKIFALFTGKQLCWSLFNKIAGLKTCNFVKNRLQHNCFPVNIAKFLRAPILRNLYKRLFLYSIIEDLPWIFYSKIIFSI